MFIPSFKYRLLFVNKSAYIKSGVAITVTNPIDMLNTDHYTHKGKNKVR